MTRHAAALLALAAALAVTGCSTPEPARPSATETAVDCLDVSADVMQTIASGANATHITPVTAAAVKAPAMQDAYLVAMTFTGPSFEDEPETGVWAVPSLSEAVGPIFAIDAFAQSFTDWPHQYQGRKYSIAEPGARDALNCLN